MKEGNEIDQLFQQGIEKQFPVDAQLWQAVEAQLPGSAGSPWFLNLNSISLVLVLFCCSLIPRDNSYKQTTYAENTGVKQNNFINKTKNNQNTINSKQSKQNTPSSNIEVVTKGVTTNSSTETPIAANNKPKQIDKKNSPNISDKKVINQPILTEKTSSNSESFAESQTLATELYSKGAVVKTEKQTNKDAEEPESSDDRLTVEKGNSNSLGVLGSLFQLSKLESNGFQNLAFYYSLNPRIAKDLNRPNPYLSKYYLEFEIATSLHVEKNIKSVDASFTNYKNENERPISFQTAGVNYVKQHKKFTYGLGVHLSQYKESVDYALKKDAVGYDISYDTTYQIVNDSYSSNGTPVLLIQQNIAEIRDPKIIQVDNHVRVNNTFSRVRVPLFIGYTKRFNNWQAELRTALISGYLFNQNGVYINEDLSSTRSFESNDQFKEFTFGYSYQLGIGYSINELTAVGIRAYFENDISSYTNRYDSKLSNQSIGIWIAIKP